MSGFARKFFVIASIVLSLILGPIFTPIFLWHALLVTWISAWPFWILLLLGFVGESFSTGPVGFFFAAVFLPWILRFFFSKIEVDFSIGFILFVALQVFLQQFILLAGNMPHALHEVSWRALILDSVLWSIVVIAIVIFIQFRMIGQTYESRYVVS